MPLFSPTEQEKPMANDLISCDDHMDLGQLPADLWTTRLPVALRDRAPRVEERDGQAVWICDGKVWGSWGGKPPATGNQRPVKPLYNSFDRAGIYDQSERRPAVAALRLAIWTATGSRPRSSLDRSFRFRPRTRC